MKSIRDSPFHFPKGIRLPQSYKTQSSTWLNKLKTKMWQKKLKFYCLNMAKRSALIKSIIHNKDV